MCYFSNGIPGIKEPEDSSSQPFVCILFWAIKTKAGNLTVPVVEYTLGVIKLFLKVPAVLHPRSLFQFFIIQLHSFSTPGNEHIKHHLDLQTAIPDEYLHHSSSW